MKIHLFALAILLFLAKSAFCDTPDINQLTSYDGSSLTLRSGLDLSTSGGGDVYARYFYGDGSNLTNLTISGESEKMSYTAGDGLILESYEFSLDSKALDGFIDEESTKDWDKNESDDFTWDFDYGDLINEPTIVDWTADQGAININAANYTDNDTLYTAGWGVVLDETIFSASTHLTDGLVLVTDTTAWDKDSSDDFSWDYDYGDLINKPDGSCLWTDTVGGVTIAQNITITGSQEISGDINMLTTSVVMLTPPLQGNIEVSENGCLYYTPNNGLRGVVASDYFIIAPVDRTLANSTAQQAIFGVPANGRVWVPEGTYRFEMMVYLTTMSATSGNASLSLSGTCVISNTLISTVGLDNSSPLGAAAQGGSGTIDSGKTPLNVVTAGTGTGLKAHMNGIIIVSTGGSLIPSIQLTTANAAVLKKGSYFIIRKIGDKATTYQGNWD